MALSSGVLGSSTLDAPAQRLARSASRVAVSPPPPPPTGGGGGAQAEGGGIMWSGPMWAASGAPMEPRRVRRWQPPLGGESSGIHSPWRVRHYSTPPTTLNLTLRHTKLSPRASRASSMLLVRLPGTTRGSRVPFGVCRLGLVNAAPSPGQMACPPPVARSPSTSGVSETMRTV